MSLLAPTILSEEMKKLFQKCFTTRNLGLRITNDQLICVATNYKNSAIQSLEIIKLPLSDDRSAINNALHASTKYFKYIARTNVIYGLPQQQVMLKILTLDARLNWREIKTYIQVHAQDFFGHPYDQLHIDYRTTSTSIKSQVVHVIAARCKPIDLLASLIIKAGYRLIAITTIADALLLLMNRIFQDQNPIKTLIYYDQHHLLLHIYQRDYLYFQESIYASANDQSKTASLGLAVSKLRDSFQAQPISQKISHSYIFCGDESVAQLSALIKDFFKIAITPISQQIDQLIPKEFQGRSLSTDEIITVGLSLWSLNS